MDFITGYRPQSSGTVKKALRDLFVTGAENTGSYVAGFVITAAVSLAASGAVYFVASF